MRYPSVLIFLVLYYSGALRAQVKNSYNPVIDVQYYRFEIELNDSNDEIRGRADITILFLKDTKTFELDLISKNEKGKGMIVNAVKENELSAEFNHTANILHIQLTGSAKAGETRTYQVSYGGVPGNGLIFSRNKFKQRTIFADNWPNRARHWIPCVDHLSDKAAVDFMITAPQHYAVISNGVLVEESVVGSGKKFTHWKEDVPLPTKIMVIGLADFAIHYPGNVNGLPVSSWVFPQDKKNGFYDFEQALEILPFFINKVGPYAYKKLANVEAITVFGGMENASAIFYNEQTITGKRGYSEELIAHEIAHQWFGNAATESGWPHVWLSEGFATGLTNLYLESKYGTDTLKARLKADRATVVEFAKTRFTPVVDSSEKENFMLLLNSNSYKKGGWVLHMLRKKLGDTLFWNGIRTYYKSYAGKNASTDDFRIVMEQVSGINLAEFFQQWLYTAGHPMLLIKWKYNDTKKVLLLNISQQQKYLFSFPLEFGFKKTGELNTARHTVLINNKLTRVEIPMEAKPTLVIADPETNLLFQNNVIEEEFPVP